MTSCLSDSQLDHYHAMDLEAPEARQIQEHLAACDSCAARDAALLAGGETFLKNVRSVARETVAAPASDPQATMVAPASDRTRSSAGSRGAEVSRGLSEHTVPGYRIVRELQAGGQGVVYEAVQLSTKKKVAIKVIREGPFADPRNRARLERGMRILAQIDHPNIVGIIDSGEASGSFYYVMNFIAGQPLDAFVAELKTKSKPPGRTRRSRMMSVAQTLELFVKICDVVHAAHVRGVIHRDLKPGNIRIDPAGEPHLLDFDLAKVISGDLVEDEPQYAKTMTGQFLGSLPWASPEQAEGVPSRIDLRTDVYSLGVVLFQMLTDRFPYEVVGNMRDILNNILEAQPAKPSTISLRVDDELETIILKCLAKEPGRRYQSAGAVAEDLRRYLRGDPIIAKRDSTFYVLRKLARRHAYATTLLLAVFTIAVSTSFVSYWLYREEQRTAQHNKELAVETEKRAQERSFYAGILEKKLPTMALGWFLLEWQAGREHRAKQIRDQVPQDSPEYAAMCFLLDPTMPEEQYLAKLSADDSAQGYFMVGERCLKNRQEDKAVRAFETCLQFPSDDWSKAAARARLAQIRALAAPGETHSAAAQKGEGP